MNHSNRKCECRKIRLGNKTNQNCMLPEKPSRLACSNNDSGIQPKSCLELWNRCGLQCLAINPLERMKYLQNSCCVVSPIPTSADQFKPFSEPLFSRRTAFSHYLDMVEVDRRCTCMKFNGIDEKCKHPDCRNNLKCLTRPSPTCSPAQKWKQYYGQI